MVFQIEPYEASIQSSAQSSPINPEALQKLVESRGNFDPANHKLSIIQFASIQAEIVQIGPELARIALAGDLPRLPSGLHLARSGRPEIGVTICPGVGLDWWELVYMQCYNGR